MTVTALPVSPPRLRLAPFFAANGDKVLPGCYGVSHSGGITGELIRHVTGAWAGHAFVYIGDGQVTCWINAAGNQLLPGPVLDSLPVFDNVSSVRILDLLGDGRSCLVWSSPLPGRDSPLEYLPLTPDVPPRLLLSVDNSLGQQTTFTYSSSATHYLRDVASGRDWSTRLPNHHPVVDERVVLDQIGNTSAVQRFEYHDGFYDGREREQRGFGQVDNYDAEALGGDAIAGLHFVCGENLHGNDARTTRLGSDVPPSSSSSSSWLLIYLPKLL